MATPISESVEAPTSDLQVMDYFVQRSLNAGASALSAIDLAADRATKYVALRRTGASTEEALEALDEKVAPADYKRGRHYAKATHVELIAAHQARIDLRGYSEARRAGAEHTEVLAAAEAGANLDTYAYVRRQGRRDLLSHVEAMTLLRDSQAYRYHHFRRVVTKDELLEAVAQQIPLRLFVDGRRIGIGIDELQQVAISGVNGDQYLELRRQGSSHQTALLTASVD